MVAVTLTWTEAQTPAFRVMFGFGASNHHGVTVAWHDERTCFVRGDRARIQAFCDDLGLTVPEQLPAETVA